MSCLLVQIQGQCSKPTVTGGTVEPPDDQIYVSEKYTVTCTADYEQLADGANTMTCKNKGLQPATIVCQLKTCTKPTVTGGTVEPDGPIDVGAEYTVTCTADYELADDAVNTMTCTNTGLQPATIVCQLKTCTKPTVTGGTVEPDGPIVVNEKYTVTCTEDYQQLADGANTMTCTNTGASEPTLTCSPDTKCDKPDVENGAVDPTTSQISGGEKYTVTCNDNYKLKDAEKKEFTCDGDTGSLTPGKIECVSGASVATFGYLIVGAIMMILG